MVSEGVEPVAIVCIECEGRVRIEAFLLRDVQSDLFELRGLNTLAYAYDPHITVRVDGPVDIYFIPEHPTLMRWCTQCQRVSEGTFCGRCGYKLRSAPPLIHEGVGTLARPVSFSVRGNMLTVVLFWREEGAKRRLLSASTFFHEKREDLARLNRFIDEAVEPQHMRATISTLVPRDMCAHPDIVRICPEHGIQRTSVCEACGRDLREFLPAIVSGQTPYAEGAIHSSAHRPLEELPREEESGFDALLLDGLKPKDPHRF